MSQPAKTIKDAYRASELKPLAGDDDRYVDCSEARAAQTVSKLQSLLELRGGDRFATVAFTGHRGCGKSTELLRLKERLRGRYHVIYFAANDDLDVNDLAYSDLFLAVAKRVEEALRNDMKFPLDHRLLQDIEQWFMTVTKETQQTVDLSVGLGTEASAGGQIPFFAKLLGKLTSDIKAGSQRKVTLRQELDNYISGLIDSTNRLLDDAVAKIKSHTSCADLLVIIDNIDRVPVERSESLFFDHADHLKQVRCNVIYTMPISILHAGRNIQNFFGENYDVLPMIKTHFKEGGPYLDGRQCLEQLVAQRISISDVFEGPDVVDDLVAMSGGCVSQLLQCIRSACIEALANGKVKIDQATAELSVKKVQFSFERTLPKEYYTLLAGTHVTKDVDITGPYKNMLYNLAILRIQRRGPLERRKPGDHPHRSVPG